MESPKVVGKVRRYLENNLTLNRNHEDGNYFMTGKEVIEDGRGANRLATIGRVGVQIHPDESGKGGHFETENGQALSIIRSREENQFRRGA